MAHNLFGPVKIHRKAKFEFECELSYEEFTKSYEEYEKVLSPGTINITAKEGDEDNFSNYRIYKNTFGIEYKEIGEREISISFEQYLLYLITEELVSTGLGLERVNEIKRFFLYDVCDVYYLKQRTPHGSFGLDQVDDKSEMASRFALMWQEYIKYRHSAKGSLEQRLNKDAYDMGRDLIKIDDMYKVVHKVCFRSEESKNFNIMYLAYLILFENRELYVVYSWRNHDLIPIIMEEKIVSKYKNIGYGLVLLNITRIFKNLYKRSSNLKEWIESRDSKPKRDKLTEDLFDSMKDKKKMTLRIDVKDSHPVLMSALWTTGEVNNYIEIEKEIGDHGEITKIKRRGKATALRAKKRFNYNNDGKKQ